MGEGVLDRAQNEIREIAGETFRKVIRTLSFGITLLLEQDGELAHNYAHNGRNHPGVARALGEALVLNIALQDFLGLSVSKTYEEAKQKFKQKLEKLKEFDQ